jgi:hypothetical protein
MPTSAPRSPRLPALLLATCVVATCFVVTSQLQAAWAHTVKQKDGTVHEGTVVSESESEVVIETTFDGKKTIARADVLYVDKSVPPLREQLQFRADQAKDAKARWELHKWAKKKGFTQELPFILEAIIDVSPNDRRARKLLGHTKVDGAWLTPAQVAAKEQAAFEAAQRAKGLVPYEGEWVTPEEKDGRERGLKKDGDDWVTEEEWHARRGERLVGGKWIQVGFKEGKELAGNAARESRVQMAYLWGPHFDAVSEVQPELTQRILDGCEKCFGVMRKTLKPTAADYPETVEERIKLALCNKLPGYVRFATWFDKTYDVESLTPGWARAVQRQHSWWHVQDQRWVSAYQFPNTDKTFVSNVAHSVGLVLLTRYKANYAFPSVWLREGFSYYLEMEGLGYSASFTLGQGGGSMGAAEGESGPVWADSDKWRPALQKLVADGMDPPLRRIARMTVDQFRYMELVKSWSLIEFLVRLDGGKFKNFIDLSKDRAKTEEEALKAAFGLTYQQVDEKWRSYVTAGFKH